MNRKLLLTNIVTSIIVLVMIALTGCGSSGSRAGSRALGSGDITNENVAQVCGVLEYAGLSDVDTFEEWVMSTERIRSGDDADASDGDAGASGFSDADCRMTVMLLAGDLIKYDSVEENYNGDYLMFDMDAIENNEEFAVLKDKEKLFTTMFGEMPIREGDFENALPDRWAKHGIAVDSEKCSVISILFKAYEQEEAFVGHTGILIDCSDCEDVDSNYMFLEKIAFGEPFRITLVDDEQKLIKILSERPDYTVEDDEPAPVVYRDAVKIGELK